MSPCSACGALARKAHAADCPRKRVPLRQQIRSALGYGPQTMPGLAAALQRPQATLNNVVFAMVREGTLRSTKAPGTRGRSRVYWLRRAQR